MQQNIKEVHLLREKKELFQLKRHKTKSIKRQSNKFVTIAREWISFRKHKQT